MNSKTGFSPKFLAMKKNHVNNIVKQVSNIYARLISRYKFKKESVLSRI